MRENTFVAKPFVNEFNQTINPGDPVIYAGSSWKQTSIRSGTYEGVYEHPKYGVQSVRVGNVADKRYKYNYTTRSGSWEEVKRKAILPLKRVYALNTSLAALDNKTF